MNTSSLHSGSVRIASVMGIPIRVHFSWLIIFGLITWSLSTYYFPKAAPELPGLSYWISGVLAAILLFLSVALHELSHSFVAIRNGMSIAGITLFIFGGVAQIKGEPPDPKIEFKMAVAGPFLSFALAIFFYVLFEAATGQVLKALFHYLAHLNLILGLFNLIPGFPMDGGRVLRAYLWKKKGDFFYATRTASVFGRRIATIFIIFGIFSIFTGFTGGIWLMLIGWFLHSAAQSSYVQAGLQEALTGVKVREIISRQIVTITPGLAIESAVNEYFLKYGYGGFPVVEAGRFLGILTLKEIRDIPKEKWREATVSGVYVRRDKRWEVSGDDSAWHALEVMINEDKGRLAVVERENLAGLITRNGIAKYVQMISELEKKPE